MFRSITTADLPIVKDIYNWYVKNSTATFHLHKVNTQDISNFLFIDHPIYQSFLIILEDEVAGYCYLTRYKPREAYNRTAEVTIYLKPGFTGKGLGIKALVHLENIARQTPLKNLMAFITLENTGSVKLFESCGFEKCAHFKNVGEKFGRILDVAGYQKEI